MDKAPEDQMFKKGGKAESFSKMHKKGGMMHKKGMAKKMSEHGKEGKKK